MTTALVLVIGYPTALAAFMAFDRAIGWPFREAFGGVVPPT